MVDRKEKGISGPAIRVYESRYEETETQIEFWTSDGLRGCVDFGLEFETGAWRIYPRGDKDYGIVAFCVYMTNLENELPYISHVGSVKELTRE